MKKLILILAVSAFAAAVPVTAAEASAPAQQRVIVELNVPANATADQISSATDSVLALLPAGSYTLNDRYTTLPYVALSAGPDALTALNGTALVTAVYNDGTVTASAAAPKCKAAKKRGRSAHAKKTCK